MLVRVKVKGCYILFFRGLYLLALAPRLTKAQRQRDIVKHDLRSCQSKLQLFDQAAERREELRVALRMSVLSRSDPRRGFQLARPLSPGSHAKYARTSQSRRSYIFSTRLRSVERSCVSRCGAMSCASRSLGARSTWLKAPVFD